MPTAGARYSTCSGRGGLSYRAPVESLQARLAAAIEALAGGGDERGLAPLLREAAEAIEAIDSERAVHEGVAAQFEAQRELILTLGCPILRLRRDVLCVPLVGPYDGDRAGQLSDAVLAATSRAAVRLVVFDLSAAHIPEPVAAEHLGALCGAVRLLGARAALAGIQPGLARLLATTTTLPPDVTIFLSLETALQETT